MNKKLLLGLLFLSPMFTLNAQSTIWSDDFDDQDISDWTLVDADADGNNWIAIQVEDNEGVPIGTPVLRSASWFDNANLTPDNWAISPAINLVNASGNITFTWDVMAIDADWDEENYTVYVATENTVEALQASGAAFNEVLSGVNSFTAREIDLSDYAGETIYIGFRHHNSSGQFTMEIDNVSVNAETLDVEDQISKAFTVYPNPAENIVTISNKDNYAIATVSVTDMNGRIVKNIHFNGASEANINISDLNNGVYIINITSFEGNAVKKLIINK